MKLREEEFYEQYHHHGGTTIIPTEIFNELYDDATEEIKRLNKVLEYLELYFSNREDYELSQIIRDTKQANIEWLDKAIGSDKE